MLEELLKAIREVINSDEKTWQKFEIELAKVNEQNLLNCQGLDNKSLPLLVALETEELKTVKALITKCPAIVDILNDQGQPAIFFVNDYSNIAEFLLIRTSKSTITCVDKHKNNILHVQASNTGNNKVFEKLCRTFPSLANQLNSDNQTPLHRTCDPQKAKILLPKMLIIAICQKASSKYLEYDGNTVLHNAVLAENKELTELVLQYCEILIYISNNQAKTVLDIVKNKAIKELLNQKFSNSKIITQLIIELDNIKKENEHLKEMISAHQKLIKDTTVILAQHQNIYQTYQKGLDQESSSTLGDVKDSDSDS